MSRSVHIRDMTPADLPWAEALVAREFVSARVVSRGRMHDVRDLQGLVAERSGRPAGLVQVDIRDGECELVILVVEDRRRGVATQLVQAARGLAVAAGCHRLWLVTTNDNQGAIAFYHKTGWTQVAVHAGAVSRARGLKPEIPERSPTGIPIEDEIEFDWPL